MNIVPLLNIIPLNILNKSYYLKNRSTSSITVIIILIIKYLINFVYLLIITKIILIIFLVFILVKGKPIIKFIINFNISLYGIKSADNLL